ncbi:unnamed protein product [Brassica oleracea]
MKKCMILHESQYRPMLPISSKYTICSKEHRLPVTEERDIKPFHAYIEWYQYLMKLYTHLDQLYLYYHRMLYVYQQILVSSS